MKIVKPMAVSFSFRTFAVGQRQELCVTCLIGFALGPTARRLISDIVLWPAIGEATGGVADEGLPKPRGEVLVYGSCHTPGALPLPSAMVRVRVAPAGTPLEEPAPVDKTLAVFGDRYWTGTATRDPADAPPPTSSETTDPVPFSEMPLGWERAFGGSSHAKNPLGRGVGRVETSEGIHRIPLPNVELPSKLVTSSSQRPEPAGFGPLDVSWPQRQSLGGSYGGRWLEEDFPGYARDTDPAFFSIAPPDQRIDGFFRGDEEYVLQNMHPTHSVLRGRLPGAAARVLVRRMGSRDVEDVKMRLDTVVFLPGKDIGIAVFRGMTPVQEDDASDVTYALAACEDLDAPRPVEHYAAALDRRLDKDQSPMLALNENELLPSFAAGTGMAELLGKLEDPTKELRERIRERAIETVRKQLVEEGVEDPDAVIAEATKKSPLEERLEHFPDPADPKALAEYAAALDEFDAWADGQGEAALQSADKELEETEKSLKKELEKLAQPAPPGAEQSLREGVAKIERARRTIRGEPPDDDAPPDGDGPPELQAPRMLQMFEDAEIEPDPGFLKKLQQADAMALETYRSAAHYMPPARHLDANARPRARASMAELRALGASLAALDWTRYDLSSFDFGKADLRKTLLEGADLTKTKLVEADLSGAVLAHATLRETRFDGATLEGTNLGATRVDGASFAGANLRKAVFARAKVRSASFQGADLTEVDWLEAELGKVDFESAISPDVTFFPKIPMELPKKGAPRKPPVANDMTGCRFPRAGLKKANFLHSRLDGVDFTEADLELVTFLSVTADGADFRGASLRKLHAVMDCSFAGANFAGADLTDAFLRGANLAGANFEGARMDGADLSACNLTGANLSRTQAKGILMVGAGLKDANLTEANLMEAMLQKAKLHGADLSRTNLFGANLGLIRVDDATRVHGTNLKRALMLPKVRKST